MSVYVLEVQVKRWDEATRTFHVEWKPMRPTGGAAYTFNSREKAERVRAVCYPPEHAIGTRVREVV